MTIISFVTWFLTDLSHAAITAGTLCSGEGKRLPISCRRVGATILTLVAELGRWDLAPATGVATPERCHE